MVDGSLFVCGSLCRSRIKYNQLLPDRNCFSRFFLKKNAVIGFFLVFFRQQQILLLLNTLTLTMDMSLEDPGVEAEKDTLRLLFKAIDVDNSGHISKEEFKEALHTSKKVQRFVNESQVLRVLVARDEFDQAFMKMDTDNSNEVTFEEFWQFCEAESDKRNIKELFKAIDKDGSKKITVDEFKWAFDNDSRVREFVKRSHILAPLIHHREDGSEDFDQAFSEIDADDSGKKGHGQIDIHEFFKFW